LTLPDDSEKRISAEISDPAVAIPNNAYATAFAARRPLKVRAKAVLKAGEIDKLHISDTA
jgi:hypothetical protein